jgi:putative hydrolase of the HAD superfamily
MIRAVLFDVGGPIDTEEIFERLVDRDLLAEVGTERFDVSDEEYRSAEAAAVASFAPETYRAIVWSLVAGDRNAAERIYARFLAGDADRERERGGLELRPGIGDLLLDLHGRGLRLGLAANQPARTLRELERHGIADLFGHREVTGLHGFRKPDVRVFLRACEDLGVEPGSCVMVGDRIDNDIVPAKSLGMTTVLFRTGRHRLQEPRTWTECPDAEVSDIAELTGVLFALLDANPK